MKLDEEMRALERAAGSGDPLAVARFENAKRRLERPMLTRDRRVKLRAIDTANRTADFVAATEGPVPNWRGAEWLRMAGADLTRYQKNPIVLNAHDYSDASCLVGSASVQINGTQLLARVRFAETDDAEELWQLVESGFLRTVSVGYLPLEYRILQDGEVDGEGDARVVGPGVVITKWELLEISLTPLPADQDALLRRSFFQPNQKARSTMNFSDLMSGAPSAPATAGATAPATNQPAAAPSAPAPAPAATRALETPAPAAPVKGELEDEVKARVLEARKRQIRALAPESMRDFADTLVMEGLDVSAAQKRLQEEYAKRSIPVGTPEAPKPAAQPEAQKWPENVTNEVLIRSFKR